MKEHVSQSRLVGGAEGSGEGANIPHVRLKEHACTRANAHADGQRGCSHAEELVSLSDCWLSS